MNNHRYKEILREFEQRFPTTSAKVVSWWPSGRFEITMRLEDGSKVAYDTHEETIQRIHTYKDDIMPEDIWVLKFRTKLYRMMQARLISSEYLAERTGISKVSISRYLNGHAIPSAYNLQKIASVLECSPSSLSHFE